MRDTRAPQSRHEEEIVMSQTIQERSTALVLEEPIMVSDPKNPPSVREILLLGPYGVLGTGVVPAASANPAWRVVTAPRRPAPPPPDSTAVRHINVHLLDPVAPRAVRY